MTTRPPAHRDAPAIRPAERADLLAVYRIEQDAFAQPWPFGAFEQYLGSEAFLVAAGEAVVGYAVADTVPNLGRPLGHLKDLAVHGDRRGEGIGQRLLARVTAVLESEGARSVKLEVREGNQAARSLYREAGFVHRRTVPGYYGDGEDALVLVREV